MNKNRKAILKRLYDLNKTRSSRLWSYDQIRVNTALDLKIIDRETTYLQQKGYIEKQLIQTADISAYSFRITAQGIDLVESNKILNFPYIKIIVWFLIIGFPTLGFYLDFFGLRSKATTYLFKKSQHSRSKQEITLDQLSADQALLVKEIWNYQRSNRLSKVIINRNGFIFDDIEKKETTINLALRVLGQMRNDQSRFENLILSIPIFFLRQIPETRWGAPYVVTVPEEVRKLLDE